MVTALADPETRVYDPPPEEAYLHYRLLVDGSGRLSL